MDSIPKRIPMIPMEARKAEGRKTKSQEKLTWDKLEQIGLGELGMTYKEMWSLTPRSFLMPSVARRDENDLR
jgi:hypothetical protein